MQAKTNSATTDTDRLVHLTQSTELIRQARPTDGARTDAIPSRLPITRRFYQGILLLGCLAWAGCANGPSIRHEFTLAPGMGHNAEIERVLLLPINATLERPAGLDTADDAINEYLEAYLESFGLSVERVSRRRYERALQAASAETKTKMLSGESGTASQEISFETLVPSLLQHLESEAQRVISPNLIIREAISKGGKLLGWDGVNRRERGMRNYRMSEGYSTPAASIMVMIHQPTGTHVFTGYGGLDLVFEPNIAKRRYDLRADLFEDEENLQEGVCVSFHPFFGDDVDC